MFAETRYEAVLGDIRREVMRHTTTPSSGERPPAAPAAVVASEAASEAAAPRPARQAVPVATAGGGNPQDKRSASAVTVRSLVAFSESWRRVVGGGR